MTPKKKKTTTTTKSYKDQQRPDICLNAGKGTKTEIKKSDYITAEHQSLSRSTDTFPNTVRKQYNHYAISVI